MRRAAFGLLLAFGLHAETLLQTDFGAAYERVSGNTRAAGELPARWRDNSNWAQVWTVYSRQEEGGRPFFRAEVTRADDGWGQIMHALPRWNTAAYMRLRLTLRASEGVSAGFGIRRNASPYNFLWQATRYPGAAWQDLTFYAHIDPADYDIGFYMLVNAPGTLDLSRFQLDRLSEAELVEELRREAPEHPKNLLRNTRFPLGLQSGWALDRDSSDGDDVSLEPDATALRIRSARPAQIYSEPFPVPRPMEPHTASLSVRGRGTFRLAALSNGRVLAQTTMQPSAEWQRVRVTFTPPLLAPATNLRLEASGEIWVDAAQVETGREATDYASAGSCEVALTADSVTRVHFEDEPAEVRYQVAGECAVLRARVVNVYGDEALLRPVALAQAKAGTLGYNVFPRRPLARSASRFGPRTPPARAPAPSTSWWCSACAARGSGCWTRPIPPSACIPTPPPGISSWPRRSARTGRACTMPGSTTSAGTGWSASRTSGASSMPISIATAPTA